MLAHILAALMVAASPCTREQRPCYIRAGEVALYSGELWPSAFALAILEDRARCEQQAAELKLLGAKLNAEKELHEVTRKQLEAELAAEREARASVEKLAKSLVEPPAWYERPEFLITVTAVVTVFVTVILTDGE